MDVCSSDKETAKGQRLDQRELVFANTQNCEDGIISTKNEIRGGILTVGYEKDKTYNLLAIK